MHCWRFIFLDFGDEVFGWVIRVAEERVVNNDVNISDVMTGNPSIDDVSVPDMDKESK